MNNKQIEPIIESTKIALTPLHEVIPLKPKLKRAKPLKYDTGEKNWNKQIDDILRGKMNTKENVEEKFSQKKEDHKKLMQMHQFKGGDKE